MNSMVRFNILGRITTSWTYSMSPIWTFFQLFFKLGRSCFELPSDVSTMIASNFHWNEKFEKSHSRSDIISKWTIRFMCYYSLYSPLLQSQDCILALKLTLTYLQFKTKSTFFEILFFINENLFNTFSLIFFFYSINILNLLLKKLHLENLLKFINCV